MKQKQKQKNKQNIGPTHCDRIGSKKTEEAGSPNLVLSLIGCVTFKKSFMISEFKFFFFVYKMMYLPSDLPDGFCLKNVFHMQTL